MPRERSAATVEPVIGGKVRAAIFEDDPQVLDGISSALSGAGYDVCGHGTRGEQAAELVARTRPELVLMDIELRGGMDGVSAAAHLRACAYDGSLVYLTAHADAQVVERAKGTRPSAYLVKPVVPAQLIAAVEVAVSSHREEARWVRKLERVREALAGCQDLFENGEGVCRSLDTELDAFAARIELLSKREREVFERAVRGDPLEQLSRELFISPYTARNHLAAIYRKLGVSSRLELSTLYLPVLQRLER